MPLAIADYDRLLAMQPDDEDIHRFRGEVYLDCHEYERAIGDFSAAIDLDRHNAGSVYVLRAKAYEALNKKELAAKDLQSAKEFNSR